MAEETDPGWRKLSDEVLSGMKEWRQAHPKATFREIEEAVTQRMSRLTARLIQDVALSSPASDWRNQALSERPQCPQCATPLQARGNRHRHLQSTGGQDIELNRTYGTCPTCGAGLFPPG